MRKVVTLMQLLVRPALAGCVRVRKGDDGWAVARGRRTRGVLASAGNTF